MSKKKPVFAKLKSAPSKLEILESLGWETQSEDAKLLEREGAGQVVVELIDSEIVIMGDPEEGPEVDEDGYTVIRIG